MKIKKKRRKAKLPSSPPVLFIVSEGFKREHNFWFHLASIVMLDRPLDMESEEWGSPPWPNSILRSWKGKEPQRVLDLHQITANLPVTSLVSFLLGGDAGLETGRRFQRVVPTDAGLCLRWKVQIREPGRERWEWGPLFKMNKGPAFRYLETSSPGTSQHPVPGNFWSCLWTTDTHGVTHLRLPAKFWEPHPQPSQRWNLAVPWLTAFVSSQREWMHWLSGQ